MTKLNCNQTVKLPAFDIIIFTNELKVKKVKLLRGFTSFNISFKNI